MQRGPIVNVFGVYLQSVTREDGTVYTERVNPDGTPWVDPNPKYTPEEIASGIVIGPVAKKPSLWRRVVRWVRGD